jgi:hypothetical protein
MGPMVGAATHLGGKGARRTRLPALEVVYRPDTGVWQDERPRAAGPELTAAYVTPADGDAVTPAGSVNLEHFHLLEVSSGDG